MALGADIYVYTWEFYIEIKVYDDILRMDSVLQAVQMPGVHIASYGTALSRTLEAIRNTSRV